MDDSQECVVCAKNITGVSNSHEWIGNIVEQMGIGEQAYSTIMDVASEHPSWGRYVSNVKEWIMSKRVLFLGLYVIARAYLRQHFSYTCKHSANAID